MSLFPAFVASRHPTPFLTAIERMAEEHGLAVEPKDRNAAKGIAVFGPRGTIDPYRYLVTRALGGTGPPLPFCLINPSTADHEEPDPTLTRCVGFANDLGASAVLICNPFAFRATDVRDLRGTPEPVGPSNDAVIRFLASQAARGSYAGVVVGWGAITKLPPVLRPRLERVLDILGSYGDDVWCLSRTKDGHPSHPLMLRSSCRPETWRPR